METNTKIITAIVITIFAGIIMFSFGTGLTPKQTNSQTSQNIQTQFQQPQQPEQIIPPVIIYNSQEYYPPHTKNYPTKTQHNYNKYQTQHKKTFYKKDYPQKDYKKQYNKNYNYKKQYKNKPHKDSYIKYYPYQKEYIVKDCYRNAPHDKLIYTKCPK